jgi:hypothetical protein
METFAEFQKVLRTLFPFVPTSLVQGGIQGIQVDLEKNYMIAYSSNSAAFYTLPEKHFFDESIFLPTEHIERMLKLSPKRNWNGIVKNEDGHYVIKIGRVRITFPPKLVAACMDLPQQENKICPTNAFKDAMNLMADYMCQDDRQINYHGLLIGSNQAYSGDSSRLVCYNIPLPEEIPASFLSFACIMLMKNRSFSHIYQDASKIIFFDTDFTYQFPKTVAKYVPASRYFEKIEAEPFVEVLINQSESGDDIEDFFNLLYGDILLSPLEVQFADEVMSLSISNLSGALNAKIKINCKEPVDSFYIKATVFTEALRLFDKMRIGKNFVLFEMVDFKYLVMKMAVRK